MIEYIWKTFGRKISSRKKPWKKLFFRKKKEVIEQRVLGVDDIRNWADAIQEKWRTGDVRKNDGRTTGDPRRDGATGDGP